MVRSSYFVPQILRRLDYSEIEYLRIQSDNILIKFNNSEDIKIICWTSKEGENPPTHGRRYTFHLQKGKFVFFCGQKQVHFWQKR